MLIRLRADYKKFIFGDLLFEKKQHLGDCSVTGKVCAVVHRPPGIAVNNHQEEINNDKK